MGPILKRQSFNFQVLIWLSGLFFCLNAQAASHSETTKEVSPEIQAIVQKAAKKHDFSAEMKQIVAMKSKASPSLIHVFQEANRPWQERWFAAMALSKFPTKENKEVLIKGSKDTLSVMRSVSVQALAVFDEEDSTKAIQEAMNDSSLLVRDSAVKSLAKLKDRGAVDLLSKELFEKRNYYRGQPIFGIRENIIHALGEIGSMKGVDPLMKIFQEPNPKMQALACTSLEKIVKPDDLQSKKNITAKCPDYWLEWQKAQSTTAKK
ncbi:MAG: HEAT repeat domain-containing protein [Bdellovibrionota bacterium]